MGIDRHGPSIERAQAAAREAGFDSRVRFEALPIERFAQGRAQFDVVTSFDVFHDLPDPVSVLRSIRALVAPGGSYVIVEGRGIDRLEPGGLEMRLKYGFSMFHCLPQSMADGGAGLGNMVDETTVRELVAEAGFSGCTVLTEVDPGKIFYHLTP